MVFLRVTVFAAGLLLVIATLVSVIRSIVLPRGAPELVSRVVFICVQRMFLLRMRRMRSFDEKDRLMALFAPVAVLLLLPIWLGLVLLGYTGMFWAVDIGTPFEAFVASGSSLLTLGFATIEGVAQAALSFSEAAIGLILVALLIAYLPSMYAAFSRREAAVTLLEVRAGTPPTAVEMVERFYRIHGLDRLREQWVTWEMWFTDIEESHTSLAALSFFRSPLAGRSWITAAGAVLDAAALTWAAVDGPSTPEAALCMRAGYLALRNIADLFGIRYHPDPHYPDQPISIRRSEFDAVYDRLAASGVPLKPDREQAWRDFAGWRVNYDAVLLGLCGLVLPPYAPWSSDRAPAFGELPLFTSRSKGRPDSANQKAERF